MVHDEVGVVCNSQYWQQAYCFVSDTFAKEYDVYLKGFVPSDQPTELKLHEKLFKEIKLHPDTNKDTTRIGDTVRHYVFDKKKNKVKEDELRVVTSMKFDKFWSSPEKPYIPTNWADK